MQSATTVCVFMAFFFSAEAEENMRTVDYGSQLVRYMVSRFR